MYVVAIDLGSRTGSLALGREDGAVLGELALGSQERPTESLFVALGELLDEHGAKPADVSLWVTSQGPGSFTGLRAAYATVKGLLLARPGVWEALDPMEVRAITYAAHITPRAKSISVLVTLGRRQVAGKLFERDGERLVLRHEAVLDREELAGSPFARTSVKLCEETEDPVISDAIPFSATAGRMLEARPTAQNTVRLATPKAQRTAAPVYLGTAKFRKIGEAP